MATCLVVVGSSSNCSLSVVGGVDVGQVLILRKIVMFIPKMLIASDHAKLLKHNRFTQTGDSLLNIIKKIYVHSLKMQPTDAANMPHLWCNTTQATFSALVIEASPTS